MNTVIKVILTTLLMCCFVMQADAKRFGGGKSFGMQRSAASASATRAAAPLAAAASTGKKWLAPLMGLAAGALIGSLLFGSGMGSMMLWLGLGLIALMLFAWFKRSRAANAPPVANSHYQHASQFREANEAGAYGQNRNNAAQYDIPAINNGPLSHGMNQNNSNHAAFDNQGASSLGSARSDIFSSAARGEPAPFGSRDNLASRYPAGFVLNDFLREVKLQFIRLQAAYDAKNLADIREFTAPEVFAEVQMQIQERGESVNHTEVLALDAQLADIEQELQSWIATVHFRGEVREELNAAPVNIQEVWHFKKDILSGRWLVAGIQQSE